MTNLSIIASQPLWVGSGIVDDQIGQKLNDYSHTISTDGGFQSASFSFATQQPDAERWFQDGLGRHIKVLSPALGIVWEGFVNTISITVGALSAQRGPLLEIANRVSVAYQTVTYNTNPPIGGNPSITAVANNTDSQARYGIVERVLSSGQMPTATAQQVRDTYLSEYAWPETTSTVSAGNSSNVVVQVEAIGYYRWLEAYSYTYTVLSSTRTIRERILDILGDDPNGIISTNYSDIAANAYTVGRYNNNQMSAWAALKELAALGDTSFNRYTIGVYDNQRVTYTAVPDDYEYTLNLRDPARRIFNRGGLEVNYWDIRPGRWMFIPDFMIGYAPTQIKSDPRYIFIESVSYTAPWGISINGGKVGRLAQILAQQGLGGI